MLISRARRFSIIVGAGWVALVFAHGVACKTAELKPAPSLKSPTKPHERSGAVSIETQFETLSHDYFEHLLESQPEWATQLGDHRYDDRLTDRSQAAIVERVTFNKSMLTKLRQIDPNALSAANRVDYRILEHNLERLIFEAEVLKEHTWNPLTYNMGSAIYGLVARDFAPLESRLRNVLRRLNAIPNVLEQAKQNLVRPPKIHTQTAILQNEGNIQLVTRDLVPFFAEVPALKAEFDGASGKALHALRDYGEWLKRDLLPRSDGDFRLGDALWRQKLRFSLASALSKEEIYRRALDDLKATQNAMFEVACTRVASRAVHDGSTLDEKKRVIKAALDLLSKERPNDATILAQAEQTLQACTEFVKRHRLVTIPDDPIRIIVMPEFQRGVAIAYCDSPGPLEKKAETFYAIAPPPSDWSAQQRESFYREYNNYMLHELTIHEAMPGHFLQLAHANRFKAPTRIRAIFDSGTFIEGWAMYSEQVMADAGYGGAEVKMQQLKLRLRAIINAILDQKIHTEGMNEQDAMRLMIDEGFQEEGESAGKWRRACLTSTQLSTYFVGAEEISDIRKAYEAKHGALSELAPFHDRVLSFGSPPPKFVRELLGL